LLRSCTEGGACQTGQAADDCGWPTVRTEGAPHACTCVGSRMPPHAWGWVLKACLHTLCIPHRPSPTATAAAAACLPRPRPPLSTLSAVSATGVWVGVGVGVGVRARAHARTHTRAGTQHLAAYSSRIALRSSSSALLSSHRTNSQT